MAELDKKLGMSTTSPVQGHTLLQITKAESQHVLTFGDGTILGEVNVALEKALCNIAEQQFALEFEVFAPVRAIRETISRATKEKDAIVRVQINVYGPRTISQSIGRELSQQKIYLQRPDYIREGADYDNPHLLKLVTHTPSLPTALALAEEKTAEKAADETLKSTIADIYSSLTRGKNLQGLEGDARLKTSLLPYVLYAVILCLADTIKSSKDCT